VTLIGDNHLFVKKKETFVIGKYSQNMVTIYRRSKREYHDIQCFFLQGATDFRKQKLLLGGVIRKKIDQGYDVEAKK